MAHGIERRAKRDLFSFALESRDFYEDIGCHSPGDRDFRPQLERHLDPTWEITRQGVWYNAIPQDGSIPDQGFKIHLSASWDCAEVLLERSLPILERSRTPFKVLIDGFILDFVNSKSYPRASAGKFMAAYPPDIARCGELMERLSRATSDLTGPYILSDRRYGESRTVFYRYGGFRQRLRLNAFGEKEPFLLSEDGVLLPDRRLPYFQLPPGMEDPFSEGEEPHRGRVKLRNRYVVDAALSFSSAGGVYAALDEAAGRKVVIKEARPKVNYTRRNPEDAVASLEKEARILQQLNGSPHVAEFIDFFQEWEHVYLVQEFLEGTLLSSYRALEDLGLLVQKNPSPNFVRSFCRRFAQIGLHLLEAVRDFHRHGVVIGDLAPSNVFVDPDSLTMTLIDFEGAFLRGETGPRREGIVTSGFVSESRRAGNPAHFTDDFFSLGAVLYSLLLPVQEFFPLNPSASSAFLNAICRDHSLPIELPEAIRHFADCNPEAAENALNRLLQRPSLLKSPPSSDDETTPCEVVGEIRRYLHATYDLEREDRLWPADYRVFTTNPLSLAFGALGPALFLHEIDGGLPDPIRNWIRGRRLSTEDYPPGLFVGLAGIAWGLAEIGEVDRALDTLDLALGSPLHEIGYDLFNGAAGLGLICLAFWHRFRDQRFLDAAAARGEEIEGAAESDGEGLFWRNLDGVRYFGYAHGSSGTALFLLHLAGALQSEKVLSLARRAIESEILAGEEKEDYIVWRRSENDSLLSPYWRYGAAGIGGVLIRFAEATGDKRYGELAVKAARYADSQYVVFPGQLVGLSGMAEFLLDMYLFQGDSSYLDLARKDFGSLMLYATRRPEGTTFPGEELIRLSSDFGTGAAGVGSFLQRLESLQHRKLFDFNPQFYEHSRGGLEHIA